MFLTDRGYYSGKFIVQLDQAGGCYMLRAKDLKGVLILSAVYADGKPLVKKKAPELSTLQESLIWTSLISMTLKRFVTGCIEQIFKRRKALVNKGFIHYE